MRVLSAVGHTLRALAIVLLSSVLSLLLVAGVVLTALSLTVTNRETVKDWVVTEHVYEAFQAGFKEASMGSQEDAAGPEPAIGQEALQQLFDEVFTYAFFQRAANQIIDGVYDWLEYETDHPEFEIKLAEDDAELRELLVVLFTQKIRTLPTCDPGTTLSEPEQLLGSDCRPRGVDDNEIQSIIQSAVDEGYFDALAKEAVITSQDVGLHEIENGDAVRSAFQLLKWSPILFLAYSALTSWLIAAAVYNWGHSRKLLGGLLLVWGIILSLIGAIMFALQGNVSQLVSRSKGPVSELYSQAAAHVVESAVASLASMMLLLSGAITAFSLLLLYSKRIWLYVQTKRSPK